MVEEMTPAGYAPVAESDALPCADTRF